MIVDAARLLFLYLHAGRYVFEIGISQRNLYRKYIKISVWIVSLLDTVHSNSVVIDCMFRVSGIKSIVLNDRELLEEMHRIFAMQTFNALPLWCFYFTEQQRDECT